MFSFLMTILLAASISDEGSDPFHNEVSKISRFYPVENYSASPEATTFLRGRRIPFCFTYDNSKWVIDDWHELVDEEVLFHSVNHPIDATIVAEMAPTPRKMLKSLVWENAEWDFNKVRFLLEEKRMVNGLEVICYQWTGKFSGNNKNIPKGQTYAFFTYVYLGERSTVQVVTSCLFKDFEKLQPEMETFLNGLISCAY